jgi:hypothetical protein
VNTSGLAKLTSLMQTYPAVLKEYARMPMKSRSPSNAMSARAMPLAHEECRRPLEYKYASYVLIPGEVARKSGMMSPTNPI